MARRSNTMERKAEGKRRASSVQRKEMAGKRKAEELGSSDSGQDFGRKLERLEEKLDGLSGLEEKLDILVTAQNQRGLSGLEEKLNILVTAQNQRGLSDVPQSTTELGRRCVEFETTNSAFPEPVDKERADIIWPNAKYTQCIKAQVGFQQKLVEAMQHIRRTKKNDLSFDIAYTGNSAIQSDNRFCKPDVTIFETGFGPLPAHTAAVLEVKSQTLGRFNSDKNVGDAYLKGSAYLSDWFKNDKKRTSFIFGVTDCTHIQWFKIFKAQRKNGFKSLVEDARLSICGFLTSKPVDFGICVPSVSLNAVPLSMEYLLGEGATSIVYKTRYEDENAAVKVYKQGYSYEHEQMILKELRGMKGIPSVVGVSKAQNAMVISPVGQPLLSLHHATDVFHDVVEILRDAHFRGFVHGDIRIPNFMLVQEDNTKKIYLLDWGFASKLGESCPPTGNILCSSDNVLHQSRASNNEVIIRGSSDDLVSLVRAMY